MAELVACACVCVSVLPNQSPEYQLMVQYQNVLAGNLHPGYEVIKEGMAFHVTVVASYTVYGLPKAGHTLRCLPHDSREWRRKAHGFATFPP